MHSGIAVSICPIQDSLGSLGRHVHTLADTCARGERGPRMQDPGALAHRPCILQRYANRPNAESTLRFTRLTGGERVPSRDKGILATMLGAGDDALRRRVEPSRLRLLGTYAAQYEPIWTRLPASLATSMRRPPILTLRDCVSKIQGRHSTACQRICCQRVGWSFSGHEAVPSTCRRGSLGPSIRQ